MQEQQLSDLESAALARIEAARSPQDLEAVRIEVLGRKGSLTQIGKDMGKLAPEDRARIGKMLNAAKQNIESAIASRQREFDAETLEARLNAEWLDLTLPAPGPQIGHLHPITQIQSEIEDLFASLGFAVLDGPEVETEYHNFDALNPPQCPLVFVSGASGAGLQSCAGPPGPAPRATESAISEHKQADVDAGDRGP